MAEIGRVQELDIAIPVGASFVYTFTLRNPDTGAVIDVSGRVPLVVVRTGQAAADPVLFIPTAGLTTDGTDGKISISATRTLTLVMGETDGYYEVGHQAAGDPDTYVRSFRGRAIADPGLFAG